MLHRIRRNVPGLRQEVTQWDIEGRRQLNTVFQVGHSLVGLPLGDRALFDINPTRQIALFQTDPLSPAPDNRPQIHEVIVGWFRINRVYIRVLLIDIPAAYIGGMHGVDLLRAQRGLLSWLAPKLGLTQPALSLWTRIPAERCLEIEKITGIPRHLLRPDLWTPPWIVPETVPQPRKRIKRTNSETAAV